MGIIDKGLAALLLIAVIGLTGAIFYAQHQRAAEQKCQADSIKQDLTAKLNTATAERDQAIADRDAALQTARDAQRLLQTAQDALQDAQTAKLAADTAAAAAKRRIAAYAAQKPGSVLDQVIPAEIWNSIYGTKP